MMTLLLRLWKYLSFPKNLQLVIMRIFQDEFLIGVSGIIFNEKNEVLLCKHTYRSNQWGLPGGYIKAKEHPREGLIREIEEETGIIVSINRRIKIRTDRETARLDISYVGRYKAGVFTPSSEVSQAAFFPFHAFPLLPQKQILLIKEALDRQSATTGSFPNQIRYPFSFLGKIAKVLGKNK